MKHDLFAEFWNEKAKRKGADFRKLEEREQKLAPDEKLSVYSKAEISSLHLNTEDNKREARERYERWIKEDMKQTISKEIQKMEQLGLKESQVNLQALPPYSVLIKIRFNLEKPYISQDDEQFYINENPICKDKVFKVPFIRPSSWKGALRWAAIKECLVDRIESLPQDEAIEERVKLVRLFGNEKDDEKEFLDGLFKKIFGRTTEAVINKFENRIRGINEQGKKDVSLIQYVNQEGSGQGRLTFFPTFFNQIGLDVMTPLRRETRTPVRGPIPFEIVPENAEGVFALLYTPLNLVGKERKIIQKEVSEDLSLLTQAIPAMLTKYGFAVKKTSGYGVVKEELKEIIVNEQRKQNVTFADFQKMIDQQINAWFAPDVSEIAKRTKDEKPLTLEEISDEVHHYRKEKKN